MLNDGVYKVEQRCKKRVVCLISQQKAGRRHRREELDKFRAGAGRDVCDVRCDIVEDDEKGWIYGVKFAFARSNEGVDRLL